jgi:hypothetical protein
MESILYEIEIIARPYSSFRGASKWRVGRQSCISNTNTITSDGQHVFIFRESLKVLDLYPITSLAKRVELKRASPYFQTVFQLWHFLNPGSHRALSREVHEQLVEVLYKSNPQSLGNPSLIKLNSKQDNSFDFSNKLGLTFAEFYDILFEIVDTLARSCLANEYCRILQNSIKSLRQSPMFCSVNLYNKRHLKEHPRASFHPWMNFLMRSLTPSSTSGQLPEIFKKISPPKEYFNSRKEEKTFDSKITKSMNLIEVVRKKNKSPIRNVTPALIKAKSSRFYSGFELKGIKASFTPVKSLYLND